MNQRIVTVVLIVAIVLGGGYYAYSHLVPPPQEKAQGPIYSTQPVTKGDISVGVDITGPLNPSRGGGIQIPGGRGVMVSGITNYMIDEVLVEEGSPVTQGQVIVRLSALELENKIKTMEEQSVSAQEFLADMMDVPIDRLHSIDPARGITLRSPIEGRVAGLVAKEGEKLEQGRTVARVVDASKFRMNAKVTPTEFPNVKTGQTVSLRFRQFDGLIEGQVVDVNPNPIPEKVSDLNFGEGGASRDDMYQFVHHVTIEGKNPGLIQLDMIARVGLIQEDQQTKWLSYSAKVEGYVKEERVINRADAIVTRVYAREMEFVKAGDPLVSLAGKDAQKDIEERLNKILNLQTDLDGLRSQFGQLEVRAPMDGIVAAIEKQSGQTAGPGEWIGHVYNTSDMRLWGQVDDVDVLLVQTGAPVQVSVDALPGRTFEGTVEYVDTMGRNEKGITTFGVNIKVKGSQELRPGMQGKAYVNAGSANDVLLVPLEAIFEEDGKPKVEILQEDGTPKVVSVQLGLMNDRVAEVKTGLEEGQLVITGSTADLLPSQRIKSNDTLLPSTDKSDNQDKQSDDTGGSSKRSTSPISN